MNSTIQISDEELLSLINEGDQTAFTEVYNRYWKRLFAIAVNKIKNFDEAEEIVQDIFVSLWAKKGRLNITGTLSIYLAVCVKYRVIKTLAKQHNRNKYEKHEALVLDLTDNSTQDWLEFEELKFRLSRLIADLPEKCRVVYQLSRESGYSQKQISEELGISEKTVEAHLGKALKKLRTGLNQFMLSVLL